MPHERKKHGVRKDKKNERMRDARTERAEEFVEHPHLTDQADVVTYKPGSARDRNRHIPRHIGF
jgi:hypothetical protein